MSNPFLPPGCTDAQIDSLFREPEYAACPECLAGKYQPECAACKGTGEVIDDN